MWSNIIDDITLRKHKVEFQDNNIERLAVKKMKKSGYWENPFESELASWRRRKTFRSLTRTAFEGTLSGEGNSILLEGSLFEYLMTE